MEVNDLCQLLHKCPTVKRETVAKEAVEEAKMEVASSQERK